MTHYEEMIQYCNDVVSKKILASKYTILACKRTLENIKAAEEDPNYPYYFDKEAASKIVDFAQATKQYNDQWRGKPLILQPWQKHIFMSIYGWKKKEDNLRRFRKAYIQIGRKQGKSTMLAVLLLYDLLITNGAQAYCACTKRDTAKIIFNCCKQTILQNNALQSRLKIYNSTSRIVNESNAGFLEALAADPDRMDGLNPSICCIDEIGSMADFDIVKRLQSGQGSRPEPLIFEIGSATDDMYSAGRQEFERADKILTGVVSDDTFFCIMYCLDEKDDWKNEDLYVKANPNLGVSTTKEFLHNLKVEALQQPSLEGELRTRNLGQWISPQTAWIPHSTWLNCINNAKTYKMPQDTSACAIIGAVDLSQRNDFSSYTLYFYDLTQKKYFTRHHFYFPEEMIDTKMKTDSPMIRKWIEQGFITPTKGPIIDYTVIFRDIKKDLETYNIREILFDPWNAATLVSEIGPLVDLVEIAQSMKAISPMAKDFEAAVIDKQIVDDNPVVAWMCSCCEIYRDANGNIKPVKRSGSASSNRIDGIVTSVMCLGRLKQLMDSGELDTRSPEEIRADMEARFAALSDDY